MFLYEENMRKNKIVQKYQLYLSEFELMEWESQIKNCVIVIRNLMWCHKYSFYNTALS